MTLYEYLHAMLHYAPSTGEFRWKQAPAQKVKAGSIAGSWRKEQRVIKINGRHYRTKDLAWLYTFGHMSGSVGRADRLDGDALSNLRTATIFSEDETFWIDPAVDPIAGATEIAFPERPRRRCGLRKTMNIAEIVAVL